MAQLAAGQVVAQTELDMMALGRWALAAPVALACTVGRLTVVASESAVVVGSRVTAEETQAHMTAHEAGLMVQAAAPTAVGHLALVAMEEAAEEAAVMVGVAVGTGVQVVTAAKAAVYQGHHQE